ncbi:MAG: glycoside hydrolase family 55 protein, partial [Planctomycetota bacterium]|nr:glycoside hydrolase family 55 protein [Planctomycetota bacterium]
MRYVIAVLMLAIAALPAADEVVDEGPWDGAPRYQIVFPAEAGHRDVTTYGAKGDGVTDDTKALQAAISDNLGYHSRIIYFPAGTYVISKTLWGRLKDGSRMGGMKLFGQERDHTVLKLADKCDGFQDPAQPQPMIRFMSNPPHGDDKGNGNAGHFNSIVNMTIDTGSDNPGANGLAWLPSNTGALRDVTVRSGDGAGVMGIDLTMAWPGPGLGRNLAIEGFDYAFRMRHSEYGMTFHGLSLRKQRKLGIENNGNTLHIKDLYSRNNVQVISNFQGNHWKHAQVVLIDARLEGPGSKLPALENRGTMYLRNVQASGYAGVLKGSGNTITEALAGDTTQQVVPSPEGSLKLPVPPVPHVPYDPPKDWAIVRNASQAQAAIDAGKTTICFPYQETRFDKTVIIRNKVKRIIGMGSNLWSAGDHAVWRFEGTSAGVTVMEWMATGKVEMAAPKDCVLIARHQVGFRVTANKPECGPLIIEDICGGPWNFTAPMNVWAYQWNPECDPVDVVSKGARMWVLGWKTERPGIQFDCEGGALELLGGLVYPCKEVPADRPMFRFKDTSYSLFTRWASYRDNGVHKIKVDDHRGERSVQVMDIGRGLVNGYREQDRAELIEAMRGPASDAAPGKSKPSRPAKPKVTYAKPSEELLASFDQNLKDRTLDAVKRRRWPKIHLEAMRSEVLIMDLASDGNVQIRLGMGANANIHWDKLTANDRAELALAVQRPREQADNAMAAAYLFAIEDYRRGRE